MKYGVIAVIVGLAMPGAAIAQSRQCVAPGGTLSVHPDLASESQPRRLLPIGGYTLAISWSPQYCRGHARDDNARFQCGSGNGFGFSLHGLWPDGFGKDWPQYCTAAAALVPDAVLRANICATPSAQLLQHEWAKHGTCMAGETPATYFARSTGMYRRLRYPDMAALSRRSLTAGRFTAAMARANRGLRADMMRVTTDREGWLDEVWLCLDRRFHYERCRADSGGVKPNTRLKIWRGPA